MQYNTMQYHSIQYNTMLYAYHAKHVNAGTTPTIPAHNTYMYANATYKFSCLLNSK